MKTQELAPNGLTDKLFELQNKPLSPEQTITFIKTLKMQRDKLGYFLQPEQQLTQKQILAILTPVFTAAGLSKKLFDDKEQTVVNSYLAQGDIFSSVLILERTEKRIENKVDWRGNRHNFSNHFDLLFELRSLFSKCGLPLLEQSISTARQHIRFKDDQLIQ